VRVHPTVRTPRQVRAALAGGDFFVEDAVRQGVTLFGEEEDEPAADAGDAADATNREPSWEAWVAKADEDCRAARYLVSAPDPFLDLACFNAQQCVEKYLKALLERRGVRFGRTHDLSELADAATSDVPELAALKAELEWLTNYAVVVRYPGLSAGTEDAERALAIAGEVRRMVGEALGLGDDRPATEDAAAR
jgi:HEPN domain-containing protein